MSTRIPFQLCLYENSQTFSPCNENAPKVEIVIHRRRIDVAEKGIKTDHEDSKQLLFFPFLMIKQRALLNAENMVAYNKSVFAQPFSYCGFHIRRGSVGGLFS